MYYTMIRKLLLFLTFISAIILYGCGPTPFNHTYTAVPSNPNLQVKRYVPIYIDKEFSVEDKLAIERAIEQWNYVLNGQIVLRVTTYNFDMEPELILQSQQEKGWLFLKVDSLNSTIPDKYPLEQCRHISGCTITLAWVNEINGNVMKLVRDRMKSDDVEYVVLHEISHLLGNPHNNDRASLMYPHYSKFSYYCVDGDSAFRVARLYGLDKRYINFCHSKH